MNMGKQSAGILLYRVVDGELQVLLGHPGGPVWANRDVGAWTLPKGEINPDEDPIEAAKREFNEETSLTAEPPFLPLGFIVQKSGKQVWGWASKGDADASKLFSNTFEIQWPKRSGLYITIAEIDRFGWYSIEAASEKINPAQVELLLRLEKVIQTGT
jgi:predicted NUDIX family NTP pyrophosphohydrolase